MSREKGRAKIWKAKSGKVVAKIEYEKKNGKMGTLPLPSIFILPEDRIGEHDCEMERSENGQILRCWIEDEELKKTSTAASPSSRTKRSSGKKEPYHRSSSHVSQKSKGKKFEDDWSPGNLLLPKDTKSLIERKDDIENFHLLFHKAAQNDGKGKFLLFKKGNNGITTIIPSYDPNFITALIQRRNEIIELLEQNGYARISSLEEILPAWRLAVGLGGESVYETSLTLHFLYGIPIIPASSIKGVTRSWIIQECFDGNETKALEDTTFVQWFGNQKHKGKVIFLDAYPTKPPMIVNDLINPHYSDYYRGDGPPADWSDPNPVFFLAVEETPYSFYALSREAAIKADQLHRYTLEQWVGRALMEHGVGAKSAVGYGIFQEQGDLHA